MSLAAQWEGYRAAIIPAGAPAVQLRESKRAFYGGAFSLYTLIMDGLESGDEATPADLEFMGSLAGEMMEFYRRVRGGEE